MVKGRTCRTLNVTRKIYIRDIEPIIRASLEMTQFSIGTAVFHQIRGSPMGSPLSPALCLMVVALSEEVWFRSYKSFLSCIDLTSRFLRYVDNRLCSTQVGSLILCSTPSCTQTSTVALSSWKRSPTRSSSASSWSLTRSHYGTLLLATSIK